MKESIEHDVAVLRLHVRSSAGAGATTTAVFEVLRGAGQSVKITEVPTSALGLPDLVQSTSDVVEKSLTVPEDLRRTLVAALNQATAAPDPVCLLDLPAPHGYLHLIPW